MLFCCLLIFFFKISFFEKFFQEYHLSVKRFGSRSGLTEHVLSGLIWFQTVCKSYQQTTLVGKESKLIYRLYVSMKQALYFKKLYFIMFYRYYACLCGHEDVVKYLLETGRLRKLFFMLAWSIHTEQSGLTLPLAIVAIKILLLKM